MKVFLKKFKGTVSAEGEYNEKDNSLVVRAGAILSKDVARSEKFRGTKSIEAKRASVSIKNGVLMEDVAFRSPSTAGNFVTGRSTDGLTAWKDENGKPLKIYRSEV